MTPSKSNGTMQRQDTRHRPSPYTGSLLLLSLVVLIASLFAAVHLMTKVQTIQIESRGIYTSEELEEDCTYLLGSSFLSIDEVELEEKLQANRPYFKAVEVKGKFRGVHLIVHPEEEAYFFLTEHEIVMLSSELKVLRLCENGTVALSELTELSFQTEGTWKVGERVTLPTKEITDTLNEIEAAFPEHKITKISFSQLHNVYFILDGNVRCDLGTCTDIQNKLEYIQGVYDQVILPELQKSPQRTAIIYASSPETRSCRLDVELEP